MFSKEGSLAVWGWPLFRRSCWAAAGISWGGLVAEALQRGGAPALWLPRGLLCLVMALLPYTPRLTLRQREWLLAFTLFLSQALILASVPWSPAVLLMGALGVVGAGLSSVAAVVVIVGVQAALLFAGGWLLAPQAKSLPELYLDPRQPTLWLVALLFLAGAGATLVTVLRRIVFVTETAWETATRDLVSAEVRVTQGRVLRELRRRIEIEIQDDAKLYAVATLSRGLAHLLNNFLMAVRGALQEMHDEPAVETRVAAARTITQGLERVSGTLKSLMAFSRRSSAEATEADIFELVRSSVAHMQTTLTTQLEVRVQGRDGLRAKVDASKFQQLIVSLALNAIEASRPGGSVLFTVRASGGLPPGLELVVEDTGMGMSTEVLRRVTEPFFSTKGDPRHPGLGLMAVWGIVQEFGGTLQFESTPKVGSRVTVWLPRLDGLTESKAEPTDSGMIDLHSVALGSAKAFDTTSGQLEQLHHAIAAPWKERLTVVFGRWSAALLGLIWAAGALQGWSVNRGVWSSAVVAVVAGWAPVPQRVRLGLLMLSCWPVVIASSVHVAFPSPIVLVGLLLPVAWATLLGTPTLGWVAVVISMLGLSFSGNLVVSQVTQLPAAFDPRLAQTWFRIGLNGALVQLMLGISVLSIVSSAKRAIAAKVAAERDLLTASSEEELEDTRRTELERERARSGKFSSTARMIGITVHDLASAVQGLAGAEFLADPKLSASETAAELANLWDVYRHCVGLAAQFAVSDENESNVRAPPINIAEATERAVHTISALVPARIALKLVAKGQAFAEVQESDLRRLLFNLITNARDAIVDQGTIELLVSEQPETIELRVSDTGKGIDPEVQAHLFQPFFTTKPEGAGTGLGLYSVYQLVIRNGGTIAVETPNVGTAFVCTFPRSTPHRSTAQASELASELLQSNVLGRVLVIDDEPMVRRFISRTLQRAGYSTLEGSDGTMALELVKRGEACVALCIDSCMPGVASMDVISEFRRRNPRAPVLICSGMISDTLDRTHANEGVRFLAKPFEPKHLVATLTELRASLNHG